MSNAVVTRRIIKALALTESAEKRNGKFGRVSAEFTERIAGRVLAYTRKIVREEVQCHPSKGKTLK